MISVISGNLKKRLFSDEFSSVNESLVNLDFFRMNFLSGRLKRGESMIDVKPLTVKIRFGLIFSLVVVMI